jgi:biotin-(acetyl-CoA carboxylase) ligase
LRLFSDSAATLRVCWPGREFDSGFSAAGVTWLDLFAGSPLRTWDHPGIGEFWSDCLIASWSDFSQYDLLRQLDPTHSAACGNLACLALQGEGFHGQHGRPWQTLAGNLHLSLKVDLDLPAAEFSRPLVMLPAVVVMDVLAEVGLPAGQAAVKWVNDVLIGGRKLAGVLTTSRSVAGKLDSAVFGLGFNLRSAPGPEATCLAEHLPGPAPELGRLLELVLIATANRVGELVASGPAPVTESYQCHALGPVPPEGI